MGQRPAGATQRDGSLWAVVAGIAAAAAAGIVTDARFGAFVLAGVLTVCAVVRGARPEPGPPALGVRSRWIDVALLGALAVGLAVLAAVVPTPV
jgi:hypothetical protein